MKTVQNEQSKIWHLVGARGCGTEPSGVTIEGTWAEIRDYTAALARAMDEHAVSNPELVGRIDTIYQQTIEQDTEF